MKMRNGFVSNSSSASFVIITTQDNFNKVIEKFEDKERISISKTIGKKSKNIELNNYKYIVYNGVYCTESDDYDLLREFFDHFKELNNSYAKMEEF